MLTPNAELIVRIHLVLLVVGELSLLLPIYIGHQQHRSLLRPHRAVLWCCIMWAILTVVAEGLVRTGRHNVAVWNLVTIFETLLLGYAFYLEMHSAKVRRGLRAVALAFLSVSLFDYFMAGLHASTKYTVPLESFLLIGVVLLYFEQQLRELRVVLLEREPMFLIGIGVITYFAGTVMIFMLQQSIRSINAEQVVEFRMMMMINSILSIALNCIIARAFWLVGRKKTATNHSLQSLR